MREFITISTSEGKDSHRVNLEHISYIKKVSSGGHMIAMSNGEKLQTPDDISALIASKSV